jgi:AraC family transcriptional regulator, regulatory protein of adaptative response / methylated-DNA-[protein]-cysteine methyltransferase
MTSWNIVNETGRRLVSARLHSTTGYGPRGRGAKIAYGATACPLGRLIVGATELGICFVALGDSDRVLEREIRGDYPEAAILRDDSRVRDRARSLNAYLSGATGLPDLPLDIRGTPFQLRVWARLRAIPAGTVMTYGEIAKRIGQPTATRAVGAAVGANPVSMLIPCHRAVAYDGSLHNYRWGVDRKRALLDLESRR